MTIKRIIELVILGLVAVVLVVFMIINRAPATLALNPFDAESSTWTFTAPLFIWLFVFLLLGIIIGGITIWISQHRYRKALRASEAELAAERTKRRNEQAVQTGHHAALSADESISRKV